MLKKVFLTTLQSPTVTAPLTRGAKVGFSDTLKQPDDFSVGLLF